MHLMVRLPAQAIAYVLLLGGAGACAAQNTPPAIQSNARLVVLDVSVTDGHGHAISGLTLEDFRLRENGVAQVLKSLDDHTGATSPAPIAAPASAKGTYSNKPALQSSVWNVLVLDLLNTGREDQARTRAEVLKFSKTLQAGAPVALVVLSASSARVLVPFSVGGAAIEKALSGKDASPVSSPLLDVFNADGSATKEEPVVDGAALPAAEASGFLGAKDLHAQVMEMDRLDMRVNQTLRALSGIGGWLGQYSGRKNLYWLSAGFPVTAVPVAARDYDDPGGSAVYRKNYLRLQQEMDKSLETARVAVFPIDVRGNSGGAREGIDTADIQGSRYAAAEDGGIKLNDDMSQHDRRVNESQAGMLEMADATGGVATMNRNGVAAILNDEFRQAEKFYTLSYSPRNPDWNGDYRKIDLALGKSGYRLYYRRGYYTVDSKPAPGTSPDNTVDAFSLSMRAGARPASGVLFTTCLKREAGGDLDLTSDIDLHTLSLTPGADGRQTASIDYAVVEFDGGGKLLGTSQIHVETRLRPGQAEQLQSIPARQKVPVTPGTRWVSVGVRDHDSGRFGTLQIPVEEH